MYYRQKKSPQRRYCGLRKTGNVLATQAVVKSCCNYWCSLLLFIRVIIINTIGGDIYLAIYIY